MGSLADQDYFLTKTHNDLANQRSIEALLNCYCRDVAAPAECLSIEAMQAGRWPQALYQRAALSGHSGAVLHIQLPAERGSVAIAVLRSSGSLNFRYLSAPFHKARGQGWKRLDYRQLAALLLESMARQFNEPFNAELYRQILNSAQMMQTFVANAPTSMEWGEGDRGYIASEQALTFGHAFHPTPKSREGFSPEETRRYSPEVGAAFQLEYLAVRNEDLLFAANAEQVGDDWLTSLSPAELQVPEGYTALPMHPWQAGYMRRLPLVQGALASGRLRELGVAGPLFHPTASVRTLYSSAAEYFYKFSLHMRLTNCVRKNSYYELESAVALSSILRARLRDLAQLFPDTGVLFEPAYVSVRFADHASDDQTLLTEGYGMLLRDGLAPSLAKGYTPMLAAALFQEDRAGASPVWRYVFRLAHRRGLDPASAALVWFDAYLERVLEPVLYCFFHHGVVFEPHLQNVVICLDGELPAQVLLRDLEGTKLVKERWPEQQLLEMGERARKSVLYEASQGWGRVAYCLLANNLFQALFHLAGEDAGLEQRLWQRLRERLARYQARHGCAMSDVYIAGLLRGEAFPYKTNLLTRVFKRADRDSQYVSLRHPLGTQHSSRQTVEQGQ